MKPAELLSCSWWMQVMPLVLVIYFSSERAFENGASEIEGSVCWKTDRGEREHERGQSHGMCSTPLERAFTWLCTLPAGFRLSLSFTHTHTYTHLVLWQTLWCLIHFSSAPEDIHNSTGRKDGKENARNIVDVSVGGLVGTQRWRHVMYCTKTLFLGVLLH